MDIEKTLANILQRLERLEKKAKPYAPADKVFDWFVSSKHEKMQATDLYNKYIAYCEAKDLNPMPMKAFAIEARKSLKAKRQSKGIFYSKP